MSYPELHDDFRELLIALADEGAEYLLIGAHAMAVHGVPRQTGDLDVLVRPSFDNAQRIFAALSKFGAPLAAHAITAEDFAREDVVYQMGLPPRRIGILTSISGVSFDEAWASRIQIDLSGVRLQVIGRDALVQNKLTVARDKDLLDVTLLRKGNSI